MATTFLVLLSAVAVLQVNSGAVRPQASTVLENLLDFEQRARSFPVQHETQHQTKINIERTENPTPSSEASTSLMYMSDGDLSKINTRDLHTVRLRAEDHFQERLGITINVWYPSVSGNLSGPILAYHGYVQWENSSGGATATVTEGGIGHNHIKFEFVHPSPGMMGYIYDYMIVWRDELA